MRWARGRIFVGLLAASVLLLSSAFLSRREAEPVLQLGAAPGSERVIVLDPGHGGEDGGAVAADGTAESGINLAVALRLRALLRFCGEEPLMTRETDISVYSPGAETLREKKVSDLKNRVALVNEQTDALLISVHQNKMPTAPSVHGAQVFYNTIPGAADCAAAMQTALNQAVNDGREKLCKEIPSSIYLMKNVTRPAVLVECGFLSNAAELRALQTPAHQMRLALAIVCGVGGGTDGA